MKFFLFIVLIFCQSYIHAQSNEKYACRKTDQILVRNYFETLKQNEAIMKSMFRTLNDREKPRLPFCWHGCATSLPKPYFPVFARQHKIFGAVEVETIAGKDGAIFFARAIKGNALFHQNAERAACASKFKPISYNGELVYFRWNILYNFIN